MPMNLNSDLLQSLHQRALAIFDDLCQIRRHLHQFPELSGDEANTTAFLMNHLQGLGLTFKTNFDGHGFIADLISDPHKDTVALRVDIDALPIQELNEVPYRSQIPGVMHACGHDVHSAIGVGVARVLAELKETLPLNIRIIFQPEEEEISGALSMIRDGALKNPVPKAIWGVHVAPIQSGKIAWTNGLFLSGFEHYLGVLSPKGDNTLPGALLEQVAHECCNAILALNRWYLPETWGEMHAFWQTIQNAPPELQHFIVYDASVNTEDPELWQGQFGLGIKAATPARYADAMAAIRHQLDHICEGMNLDYRILPMGSMGDVRNNSTLMKTALPTLKNAIGEGNTIKLNAAFPFNCEDFFYYTKYIPGAMVWLGGADPSSGKYAMLHTPNFDVDENCLLTGTLAMASLLLGTSNFSSE